MFIPRFPGIPEMLYFPTPKAEGNITSRGFPGTEGQTFGYTVKSFIFVGLKFRGLEFKNEFVDI